MVGVIPRNRGHQRGVLRQAPPPQARKRCVDTDIRAGRHLGHPELPADLAVVVPAHPGAAVLPRRLRGAGLHGDRSCCGATVFPYSGGINEFLNNALSLNPDVRAWFGTILQSIQNSGQISTTMQTPLYVVRTGLLRDTSPLYVKTVRMTTVGQMIQEITPPMAFRSRWNCGDPGCRSRTSGPT